jgi:hypothetical protein
MSLIIHNIHRSLHWQVCITSAKFHTSRFPGTTLVITWAFTPYPHTYYPFTLRGYLYHLDLMTPLPPTPAIPTPPHPYTLLPNLITIYTSPLVNYLPTFTLPPIPLQLRSTLF